MKQIVSEMAGIVVEVMVHEGDQITEGQEILSLESMKMIMPVEATVSGVVKEIKVEEGQFLNEGDVILVAE